MSSVIPRHCRDYIGKFFIEYSKEKYRVDSDYKKKLPQPPQETPAKPSETIIQLPDPDKIKLDEINFLDLVNQRKSVRQYTDESITLQELSYLLWCTQGVKQIHTRETSAQAREWNVDITLRTVPSAGLRNPLDTYLVVNRVEGLESGLYRFLALQHKLVQLATDPDWSERLADACLKQRFVGQGAVAFIWVCNPYRTEYSYGNRGYRYIFLDSGHVCQNLYLASEAIGCGTCAVGAFDDDIMNELLGVDGENQFVIYVASVGRKVILDAR
jgi:SagB-type dehydrogenase family enzyme